MVNDGFVNETEIVNHLNCKKFKDINDNMKNLIRDIFKNDINLNDEIFCEKKAGQNKSDIIIKINNESHSISVKKGGGNSVHQEPVEEFISFLEKEFNATKDISDDLRFFVWGDNTLDGTGNPKDRMDANELKKAYPEKMSNIIKFFDRNRRNLIDRFLIKGPKSNNNPDFLYHGNLEEGIALPSKIVLNWASDELNRSSRAALPIGHLTFQAWNRNIENKPEEEHRRGDIQLKWGTMKNDFEKIRNEINEK